MITNIEINDNDVTVHIHRLEHEFVIEIKIWVLKDFLIEEYPDIVKANSEQEWVEYEGSEGVFNKFTDWKQLFDNDLDTDIVEHFISQIK